MNLAQQHAHVTVATSNGGGTQVNATTGVPASTVRAAGADPDAPAAIAADAASGSGPASPMVVSAALWSNVMSAEG